MSRCIVTCRSRLSFDPSTRLRTGGAQDRRAAISRQGRRSYHACIFFLIILFSCNLFAAEGEADRTIRELESKAQKSVTLPKIEKGRLENSFKYYILPDHELPIVKAIIYIKGGIVYDPQNRSGLTAITTNLIRTGGTQEMRPDSVDEYLDRIASSIQLSAYDEYLAASIRSRSEHFEKTLTLLLEMLFTPRFDLKRFDLVKKQFKNSVKRRADSPEKLAATGFNELIYGKENPWGDYPTQASIDAVTIEDVKDLHRRFFNPQNMIIGVSGDIDTSKVLKILKSYKNYPTGRAKSVPIPEADPTPVPGIHIIDKDSNQAVFNIGQQGSYRFNPDKYNLIIMNDILGGGGSFNRILPSLIRVKMGLAYSIWSSYSFGPREAPGTFKIFLTTKTASVGEALNAVTGEFKKFAKADEITEEDVNRSKKSILSRLVFEYSSASDIIINVVRFSYFGYPDDYIEVYGKKISEVKSDGVKRVAKEYLHPERVQVVVVGDKVILEEKLKGQMKVESLTIEE